MIADQPDLGGDYHLGGQVLAPAFKEIVTNPCSTWVLLQASNPKAIAKESKQDNRT